MRTSGKTRLAGVTGDPVSHSLSPLMMSHWIAATGLDAAYLPFPVAAADFPEFVRGLAKSPGVAGLNVTLPHKEAALALADRASTAARAIGAANLLTFRDGEVHADNTDASGFLTALEPENPAYEGANALVLGAGGAARALVHALLTSGCKAIMLSNRTRNRAEAIAEDLVPEAGVIDWEHRNDALARADLVINATSLGLKGESELELDWSVARKGAIAFDSVYVPLRTGFLAGAEAAGLCTIDGLDMLIGQARPSFAALFGAEAPIDPAVRPVLLDALGGTA